MPLLTSVVNNECEWKIRGEFDLSSAAAVTATRGTNLTTTKTGTGAYSVVLKDTQALQLVEILHRDANFSGGIPATATGINIASVTQSASTGDITIVINTLSSPTTGANTDTTAATTVDFEVIIRTCRLVSPI